MPENFSGDDIEQLSLAKNKVYTLLSSRDYSVYEIKQKLQIKGYTHKVIEQIVTEFKEARLLDDTKYAQMLYHSMIEQAKGGMAIRMKLFQKGIEKQIVEETMQWGEEQYGETAEKNWVEFLEKRLDKIQNLDLAIQKRRIYSLAQRRGIPFNVVEQLFAQT